MKKKMIIICSILLIIGVITTGIIYGVANHNKDLKQNSEKESFDNTIVSIVTMDINPSIEINLNKDYKVVRVNSLNDDSKKILEEIKYKKKKIENVIPAIIESLKENNYLNEESYLILINVESNDEKVSELIKNAITKVSQEKQIKTELVIQKVEETEELKELAKQNNITISKAYYIMEQIKDQEGLKIEDFKDISISEIKTKIDSYKEEQKQDNNSNTDSSRTGSISKCQNVKENITREQAINIAVSDRGGNYNPAGYCDIRSVDAYGSLSPEGVCSIMVSFNYKQQNCTYYVNVETGQIVGNPICTNVATTINDSQCIIMRDIGVSAREQISIKTETDTGSEIVSTVEDNQGDLYEYHISKQNGAITSKALIKKAEPVYAGSESE